MGFDGCEVTGESGRRMAGAALERHQSSHNEKPLWTEMPPMGKRLPLADRKPPMWCHVPGRGRSCGGRLGRGMDRFAEGTEEVAFIQAVVALHGWT